jgi:hypothetical protein
MLRGNRTVEDTSITVSLEIRSYPCESVFWILGEGGEPPFDKVVVIPGLLLSSEERTEILALLKELQPRLRSLSIDVDIKLIDCQGEQSVFRCWNLHFPAGPSETPTSNDDNAQSEEGQAEVVFDRIPGDKRTSVYRVWIGDIQDAELANSRQVAHYHEVADELEAMHLGVFDLDSWRT